MSCVTFLKCTTLDGGSLDKFLGKEVGDAMRALGENPTEAELYDALEQITTVDPSFHSKVNSMSMSSSTQSINTLFHKRKFKNENVKVDFSQFLIVMAQKMQNPQDEKDIRDAFKIFDTDNKGKINVNRFVRVMTTIGEPLTEKEVRDLISQVIDKHKDGNVDYEELMQFMLPET